jgi:hypothetical protein
MAKAQYFDRWVDRDVPIAIYHVKYRAGTARSTLPDMVNPSRVVGVLLIFKSTSLRFQLLPARISRTNLRLERRRVGFDLG